MSGDHNYKTGHEVDAIPSSRMFNLLVALTVITLGACIGLIQVFNNQRDAIGMKRAKQGSFLLRDYQAEMKDVTEGYGPTAEAGKFFMPVSQAKQAVLKDPSKLAAAPAPAGWVHPDDMQTGGAAAPAEPEPAPEDEGAAEGDTDGAAPEGEAQDAAPAAGDEAAADGAADAPADKPAAQDAEKPAKPAAADAPPKADKKPAPAPAKKPTEETKAAPEPAPAKKPAEGDAN